MTEAYRDQQRQSDDGERNLDKSLNFMEDFYAYAFVYQLKRKVIYGEGEDSEDEQDE